MKMTIILPKEASHNAQQILLHTENWCISQLIEKNEPFIFLGSRDK